MCGGVWKGGILVYIVKKKYNIFFFVTKGVCVGRVLCNGNVGDIYNQSITLCECSFHSSDLVSGRRQLALVPCSASKRRPTGCTGAGAHKAEFYSIAGRVCVKTARVC